MTINDREAITQPYVHRRRFWIVRVEMTRREYVCLEQEELGDRIWYDQALMDLGYSMNFSCDAAQANEMQSVMSQHGYRRIMAMRRLSAHDLLQVRRLPNPRSLELAVEDTTK